MQDIRTLETGRLTPTMREDRIREHKKISRGDRIEVNVLRLDSDGNPIGNRKERRMQAARLRRKGS